MPTATFSSGVGLLAAIWVVAAAAAYPAEHGGFARPEA